MLQFRLPIGLLVAFSFASQFWLPPTVRSQEDKPAGDESKPSDEKEKDALKTIDELAENCERIEGLFTLLRDRESGEVFLLVKKEQLGKEFIHFSYTENGVARLGLFRGRFQDERVFTIERDFRRLRFVSQPTRYVFDPNSALRLAAEANVSPAVLAAEKLVAADEKTGEYAVSADSLFLSETFQQIKPSANPDNKNKPFALGKLSADKTRFADIRSFPKNTDLDVEYVYQELAPAKRAERDEGVTDSRYLTVRLQHSLIEMPDNDYQPRRDDARVGYFMTQFDDMTSTSATPYRDYIHRWNLKKKHPKAKLSEPVEPIVWWMENTTPRELRETVRTGVLAWNEAFEQAGFKNAVVVRTQADDSNWDASDLRYNVLRWTSSPDPPFGGYGPSFVNPRTGQILGADIMLEWVFLTHRVRYRELFGDDDKLALGVNSCGRGCPCTLASGMHHETLFGRHALAIQGASRVEVDRLIKDSLRHLILHEVGHTLGLMHNFRASHLHMPGAIHDKKKTSEVGLSGSVMDYPAINLAAPGEKQGQYYETKPGPYDKWAIEFGYSPELDDPNEEEKRLGQILARSTQPELAFANDADDMRSVGRGIDPRAMIFDLTGEPISWAEGRVKLAREVTGKLLDSYDAKDQSYHRLRDQYFLLTRQQDWAGRIAARFIGGVYNNRSTVGQPNAAKPLVPVKLEDQRRAMKLLTKYLFAPDAFVLSPELLAHLQKQRRGFNHWGENEDIQIHDHILRIQRGVLDHLLHVNVLRRITDSKTYGNKYSLAEMMTDLTAAIFDAEAGGNVNSVRQNLQIEYVRRLTKIAPQAGASSGKDPDYDYLAQSIALQQLRQIRSSLELESGKTLDAETRAHRGHLKLLIDRAVSLRNIERL
jgi:hypothetical protein